MSSKLLRLLGKGRTSYLDTLLGVEPASLLACWPCDELSGTNADNAEGTAARDGTYTGVTLGQNVAPFICPLFDGANDYITLPAGFQNAWDGDAYTISAFVQVSGKDVWTDSTSRYIFRIRADGNNQVHVVRSTTDGRFTFFSESGNEPFSQNVNSQTTTDWFHVAITNDLSAGQTKFYHNGEGATESRTQAWAGIPSIAILGAGATTPTNVWDGYLAYVAIWNKALTAAQILTLYNAAGV